jgi:hypothetical protein
MLVLLLPLFVAPVTGCRVEAEDDDDDLEVKVDNEGSRRGLSVDTD